MCGQHLEMKWLYLKSDIVLEYINFIFNPSEDNLHNNFHIN